jgi:hypothetical protein
MRLCALCNVDFDMNLGKISAKHHRGAKSNPNVFRGNGFKSFEGIAVQLLLVLFSIFALPFNAAA